MCVANDTYLGLVDLDTMVQQQTHNGMMTCAGRMRLTVRSCARRSAAQPLALAVLSLLRAAPTVATRNYERGLAVVLAAGSDAGRRIRAAPQ